MALSPIFAPWTRGLSPNSHIDVRSISLPYYSLLRLVPCGDVDKVRLSYRDKAGPTLF